jgi:hypothetical protein
MLALEISTQGCRAFPSERLLFTLRRRRSVLISCLMLTLEISTLCCGILIREAFIYLEKA